jgi:hypothetical protein
MQYMVSFAWKLSAFSEAESSLTYAYRNPVGCPVEKELLI